MTDSPKTDEPRKGCCPICGGPVAPNACSTRACCDWPHKSNPNVQEIKQRYAALGYPVTITPKTETATKPGERTEARLAVVQSEWRAASQQIAHHRSEIQRWQQVYDKLGTELAVLEDAFPIDWS